ncbi:hypothetical protein BDV96DRAFT_655645 [Lophiotrema nucula]|uniref:Uncharacterized protein n=1 Tax=Lophiotrema nucula TaxID=690887 RepID=A0A6A5YGI4_9PLEO|nr:hypothetical protein BDV96DRAFT_655645 [Lophiotrema nucula]
MPFQRLKHLKLPLEFLVGGTTVNAPDVLPSSLQTLEITFPFISVVHLFENIVRHSDHFKALGDIRLHFDTDRGDSEEVIIGNGDVMDRLSRQGIRVTVLH